MVQSTFNRQERRKADAIIAKTVIRTIALMENRKKVSWLKAFFIAIHRMIRHGKGK